MDVIRIIESNPAPGGWRSLADDATRAYLDEVDAQGDADAQIAFCRKTLDPTRKTYFRQLAAMDRLVELLGQDAVKDLGPYIGHEHWRFQDHSRALIMKLKGDKVVKTLLGLAASDDDAIASSALILLGARGDKEGIKTGLSYIESHESPLVRGAAAQAIYGGSQGKELDRLLKTVTTIQDIEERDGYEAAFLMAKTDTSKASSVAAGIKKIIPKLGLFWNQVNEST